MCARSLPFRSLFLSRLNLYIFSRVSLPKMNSHLPPIFFWREIAIPLINYSYFHLRPDRFVSEFTRAYFYLSVGIILYFIFCFKLEYRVPLHTTSLSSLTLTHPRYVIIFPIFFSYFFLNKKTARNKLITNK